MRPRRSRDYAPLLLFIILLLLLLVFFDILLHYLLFSCCVIFFFFSVVLRWAIHHGPSTYITPPSPVLFFLSLFFLPLRPMKLSREGRIATPHA